VHLDRKLERMLTMLLRLKNCDVLPSRADPFGKAEADRRRNYPACDPHDAYILLSSSSWSVMDLSPFSRQSLKDGAEGINAEPRHVVIEGMV
jgi:hypothetical protein